MCGHLDLHHPGPLLARGCLHLSPVGTLELALPATLTPLSSSLADLGIFRRAAMVLYTDCIQQCSRPMYMVGDFSHRSTSLSVWSPSRVQKERLSLSAEVMLPASLLSPWLHQCISSYRSLLELFTPIRTSLI